MNEQKKNLIFLIPSLSFGGAEVMMVQQIGWLTRHGWNIFAGVLSHQNETGLVQALQLPEDHIFCSRGKDSVLNATAIKYAVKHHAELKAFIRRNGISVVVANMPLAHLWGRLAKLGNPDLRLVIYHHATQYKANPLDSFAKVLFNKMQRVLANHADDLTICISNAVKEDIQTRFTLRNEYVLYNSVENRRTVIQSSAANVYSRRNVSELLMIIPGRLHPVKGHLFFLQVFCKLREQKAIGRSLRLIIAGGGPMEQDIQAFVANNRLEDCVQLTGTLDNDSLLAQIFAADLVVIPSQEEGLGIVAIESLMLGKTVVASDAGGLKEVIRHGENGYLFKSCDSADCLQCCLDVINRFPDSLFPEQSLIDDYEREFSFERHMHSLIGLVQSLN